MKLLLILIFSCSLFANDYSKQYKEVHGDGKYSNEQIDTAVKKLDGLRPVLSDPKEFSKLANLALRAIIKIGTKNLRAKGHRLEALRIERQWRWIDGTLTAIINNRNIGDFEPISQWLSDVYDTFEENLGLEVCSILRLTDIKTLNYGLRVVCRPCNYGLNDFYEHFVADERYKGVAPVASYWAVVLGCSIGTYSIGYFFICSPIGIVVEAGVKNKLAPWAAPIIYDKACNIGI